MVGSEIRINDIEGKALFNIHHLILCNENGDFDHDSIRCISTYTNNLYVGTLKGRMLHYHKFEDAPDYMLISQLKLSDELLPVKKILIMNGILKALVIVGTICVVYNLPELSACQIGKLKDVNDVLLLAYSQRVTLQKQEAPLDDKVILLSSNKIRIIQIRTDLIKLLKDINYSKGIKGVSAASSSSINYSNLGLVANEASYDLIDLKQTKKIPLFDYNPSNLPKSDVPPQIIPFIAQDKDGDEEYLVTIRSDESTTICMFFNSAGDVTRGTLSFLNEGYPKSGLLVKWPFVFGAFEKNTETRLLVSSLIHLNTVFNESITPLIMGTDDIDIEQARTSVTSEDESVKQEVEPASGDDSVKQEVEPALEDDSGKQEVEPALEEDSGKQEVEPISQETNTQLASAFYNLCDVPTIELDDAEMGELLSKIRVRDHETNPLAARIFLDGTFLIFSESDIWLVFKKNEVILTCSEVKKYFEGESANSPKGDIKSLLKSCKDDVQLFLKMLLVFVLIFEENFAECLSEITESSDDILLIDPRMILFLFIPFDPIDQLWNSFNFYVGLKEFIEPVRGKFTKELGLKYLIKVYKYLPKDDESLIATSRAFIYGNATAEVLDKFVSEEDENSWRSLDSDDHLILKNLEQSKKDDVLFILYKVIIEFNKDDNEISEKLCELCLRNLSHPSNNRSVENPKFFDTVFRVLKSLTDEKIYGKYLLELLKINPDKGVQFMKENKNEKFASTHNHILEEISSSNGSDFSMLKIEILESALMDDSGNLKFIDDLLFELLKTLKTRSSSEETKNNFEILQSTYKIENSLSDDIWPKISWSDYINIHMKQSECEGFLELYVKVYELFLIRLNVTKSSFEKFEDLIGDNPMLSYFKLLIEKRNPIPTLLSISDFSSAEYFAIYGEFRYSRKHYYKEAESKPDKLELNDIQANLRIILNFYLEDRDDKSQTFLALKHFTTNYGITFFNIKDILISIPDYIPLIYIQEYLMEALVELGIEHREMMAKKMISKAEKTFTADIYRDLSQ
ncbi:uncharacterized protein PRCAT00003167001 [Priceomyces carsonii]|uniref:uncharacterized protein n=1 Tax=Priceomyces carsonii TaxID=28549 RepID=UPI002EDB7173|nr:unnamed protein product [Priceomyces carsonii]